MYNPVPESDVAAAVVTRDRPLPFCEVLAIIRTLSGLVVETLITFTEPIHGGSYVAANSTNAGGVVCSVSNEMH